MKINPLCINQNISSTGKIPKGMNKRILMPKQLLEQGYMSTFESAEKALLASQQGSFPQHFIFEGNPFVLYKHVFSPSFFKGSSVYVNHLPLKEKQSMLDMGCGCGIIGITAFKKYKLDSVVCADINGYAVKNTRRNIQLNNLGDNINVIQSNVFSNIDNDKKFDLIFWNAPYFDGENIGSTILHKSMYDKNYENIKKFITDGQNYLNEDGKIMLGFSTSKFSLEWARRLIREIGYDLTIYFQKTDSLGFKQEILEVTKLL